MTSEEELQEDIELLVEEIIREVGYKVPLLKWVNLKTYVNPLAKSIVQMSKKYVESKLEGYQKSYTVRK